MTAMERIIPTTMATQHPDNARKPYWHFRPFISAQAELKESFLCFSDLDVDEYNWDWEGKFVDEAVVDRLLHQHYQYFRKNPLGKNKFLTFRFPNPRVEKQFRLARALMVAITSSLLAQSLGFADPPIFEAILPLTETAEEIIDIQEAFKALVSIEHKLLKMDESIKHIEIIPLFEAVDTIIKSDNIIRKYIKLHQQQFGTKPEYLRPYVARSDPALNSSLVPTILALKVALTKYQRLENELEVKLYPMLGTGSLPFRGGLSPETITKSLNEYAGVATLVIQSAFRYDFPKKRVTAAIADIKRLLPHKKFIPLTDKDIEKIMKIIPYFTSPYQTTIEGLASEINALSIHVAKRRERMLHIGLFGYSRGVGQVQLPRAITFTAALYSLGIPPELIGTGRGLKQAQKQGLNEVINKAYLNLKEDLTHSGHFLNKENLSKLAKKSPVWGTVLEDVTSIEEVLKIELGPQNEAHQQHKKISGIIFNRFLNQKEITQLITLSGVLRKSLG